MEVETKRVKRLGWTKQDVTGKTFSKAFLYTFFPQEGVACLIQHRLEEGVNLAKKACRLSSRYSCVNDRAIRGYASAVYAAADRFAGDQDGAKEHLADALEVRTF